MLYDWPVGRNPYGIRAMKRLFISLLVSVVALYADMATFAKPNGDIEIKPQAVPTSTTTVVTGDVHLTNLTITVVSGTPTITVADKQGTPIPLFSAITTTNGTTYFLPPGMYYYCPGGFTIVASGAGANFYASWR